jgi:hypothetical protein
MDHIFGLLLQLKKQPGTNKYKMVENSPNPVTLLTVIKLYVMVFSQDGD